MTVDDPLEEEIARWFRALDRDHPAVQVLWKAALDARRKAKQDAGHGRR